MAKVDPNDEKFNKGGGKMEPVGTCTGDFVALGFEHFTINNKPVVEIRSVCIASSTGDDDGKELRDLFFLHSDGAISRFVKFAKDGCGWREAFDPESAEDVAKIIANRPFRAKVKAEPNGEYIKHETGWNFYPPRLEKDPGDGSYVLAPSQLDAITNARKAWDGYLKWRADNPRDGGGSAGGSSGSSGSSGAGSSGAGGGDFGGGDFDDIPF